MPYCPKCKNEYTEGITVCADCGEPLVEKLSSENDIPLVYGTREELEEILRFLQYAGIKSGSLDVDSDTEESYLTVSYDEEGKARKLIALYNENKKEEAFKEGEPASEVNAPGSSTADSPKIYANKSEKLDNLQSSAYTLLLAGAVGLLVMVLAFTGVLDFHLAANIKYMTYLIMSLLFILFIVFGIHSFVSAKTVKIEAEKERHITKEIKNWFHENFDLDKDDLLLPADMEEEIKYFKRSENMKRILKEAYSSADDALLDAIIEELYQEIYE